MNREKELQEKVDELTRQYIVRPLVTECATEILKEFDNQLRRRDVYTKDICFDLTVLAEYDATAMPFECKELYLEFPALWTTDSNMRSLLCFKTKNIKTPENEAMTRALMKASVQKAVEMIRKAYATDPSGTPYQLETTEYVLQSKRRKKARGYAVSIHYTAQNGEYIPPQEW